jgi:hypothetical protein
MDCDEIIDQLLGVGQQQGVGQQHRDSPRIDRTTLTDPCSSRSRTTRHYTVPCFCTSGTTAQSRGGNRFQKGQGHFGLSGKANL